MGQGRGGERREDMRRWWEVDNKAWVLVDKGGAGDRVGMQV